MGTDGKSSGLRKTEYSYTGEFDSWVPAAREFFETMMPETLSKRVASSLLIAAGLANEDVTRLTGLCIRSVHALRKQMEEQEATADIFNIKPGSGRKRKTEEVEDKVFAELDKGGYHTNRQVAEMLGEKFGIKASVNLAARLVKRWKKARENGAGKKISNT